jgi:3-hydroxyisobutyrate dehydrogenase-like beta-hydroxyacid dehydrogenase
MINSRTTREEATTSPIAGIAMKIGFLGLGSMGTPMALRLLAAGHELSVWNRSEERTKPLIREGAIAAATPAEAELGSDTIVTMLLDDAAYEEVLFGVYRLMDALSPGVLHILCGTISIALAKRLTAEHANRDIDFVGAPVFGRPSDAEGGRLWTVAAGADQAIVRARPLLEAFSRGITVAGKEPQQAFAMKLEANFSPPR